MHGEQRRRTLARQPTEVAERLAEEVVSGDDDEIVVDRLAAR